MKNKQTVLLGFGVGIGFTALLLVAFFVGLHIGRGEGAFPFWERRYAPPREFVGSRFGHGTLGTIDSIGNNTFIVKERSGELKTVLVDAETRIRSDGSAVEFSSLKKDEQVIVIGEPQEKEGAIKANVIRVFSFK